MNLGELLTELRENILYDRSDRVAGTPDYLWSDATLVRYIDEAQRRLARRGLVLRDGTTEEVTDVTLCAGVSEYALHPAVMAVLSARLASDKMDLARAGHTAFDTYHQPDPYFFDTSQLSAVPPGKPLAYGTDEHVTGDDNDSFGVVTLRIFPEPSAAYKGALVKLRVVRMPIKRLSATDLTAVPEVPESHHLAMLDWAAYLALRIVDVDAGMPARAAEFRASFEQHVQEARQEAMRKLFAPAQWGFGRNAFSWER